MNDSISTALTSHQGDDRRPGEQGITPSLLAATKPGSSEVGGGRITPARTAAAGFLRSLLSKNPNKGKQEGENGDTDANERDYQATEETDEESFNNEEESPERESRLEQTGFARQRAITRDDGHHESDEEEDAQNAYPGPYDYNYGHPSHGHPYYPYPAREQYFPHQRRPPFPHGPGRYPIPPRSGPAPRWADRDDPRHEMWVDEQHPRERETEEDRERWAPEVAGPAREYYGPVPPPYFYPPHPDQYHEAHYWNAAAVAAEYGEYPPYPQPLPPYPPVRGARPTTAPSGGPSSYDEYEYPYDPYYPPFPPPRKGMNRPPYPYPFGPPGPGAPRFGPGGAGGREPLIHDQGQHQISPPHRHHPMPFGPRLGPHVAVAPRRMSSSEEESSPVGREMHDPPKSAAARSAAPTTETTQEANSPLARVYCTCRKSKCLKLYCQCFSSRLLCLSAKCRCVECKNNSDYDKERRDAMHAILARNPSAFETKILEVAVPLHAPVSSGSYEEGEQRNPATVDKRATAAAVEQLGHHKVGCKCRKSACLKKYCECYNAQVRCTNNCRCVGCKNNSPGGGDDAAEPHVGNVRAPVPIASAMHTMHDGHRYMRYPPSAFSPTKSVSGFAISQLKTRPGGQHAQVVDAAQHLAFLKHDSTPTKQNQNLFPSPTSTTDQSHSIVTNSDGHSVRDEKRASALIPNTPEKRQLSIPSLSKNSSPIKTDDKSNTNSAPPSSGKRSNPLLVAAMAMTELFGGQSAPPSPTKEGESSGKDVTDEPPVKKIKFEIADKFGGNLHTGECKSGKRSDDELFERSDGSETSCSDSSDRKLKVVKV